MKMSLLRLFLIAALSVAACSPFSGQSPTGTDQVHTPSSASTLPAKNTATQEPEPSPTAAQRPELPELDLTAGLLEGANVPNLKAESLTRYWIEIEVQFEPGLAEALIDGIAHIEYTNTTGEPLYDLVLRLWPNDPQYQSQMVAGPVLRDGRTLDTELQVGETVLRIPFSLPIQNGESLLIDVPFRVEIGSFHGGNPSRLGITESVLIAPTFYPLIPRWLGEDWEVEDPPPGGDTTNSDIALYHLVINAPQELDLVASGVEIDRQLEGELQRVTVVTGPMRDVAFALGPFERNVREVDDVSLQVWTLAEHETDVETLLDSASFQFEMLSELVGPYPYPELDIVDAPGAFGGIEYPGLVYIGTVGTPWVVEPTVHEIAHQWFYALIGGDQVDEPWLDEAAATFATALYYENAQGSGRGAGYLSNLRAVVRDNPNADLPIGLPVAGYSGVNEYAVIVYFKGALFLDALRQRLGEREFEAFLKGYYEEYLFESADAEGFQAVAEEACDCDLDDLFDLWVFEGGEIPGLTP
ncbi:MAG: M1 family metallopeptidase [Anaerolineales bacterium]